jgi:aminopeptidase N
MSSATPDIIHQAQFALDVKARVLPLYETVFDVEFPLPKLDTLVANDFDAGAMENWVRPFRVDFMLTRHRLRLSIGIDYRAHIGVLVRPQPR